MASQFYTAEALADETGLPLEMITTSGGRPIGFRRQRDPGVPSQPGDVTFPPDDAARNLMRLKPAGYALLSDAVRKSGLSADRLRRAAGEPVISGMSRGDALYRTHDLGAAWATVDRVGHGMALREHRAL